MGETNNYSPLNFPDMNTSYRLAKESDITNISAVFAEAYDDLYRRRGFAKPPTSPIPPSPIFGKLIHKTPNAFWVAEEEGKVVGFSDSFVRGSFWYFSWLFISPAFQGHNIGRGLLERTLRSWNDIQITNRATITFAFNPVSQFLYMKYGMYPREPVYYVEAPSKAIMDNEHRPLGLDFEELTILKDASAILRELDEFVLGFSLDWHHEFFFETKRRCYLFKDRKGDPAGYVYVHPSGAVGPMAVNSNEFTEAILETALRLAANQGSEKVRFYAPGSNVHAMKLALKYKMQLDPYVFMSTKPFAKWENYVFHSAALM